MADPLAAAAEVFALALREDPPATPAGRVGLYGCDHPATRAILAAVAPGAAVDTHRPDELPNPTAPTPADDVALVHATKQRAETLAVVARAWEGLAEGGRLLFFCPKLLGAKGYQKRFSEVWPATAVLVKNNGRLLDVTRTPDAAPPPEDWQAAGTLRRHPETGFVTAPGIFAWDRIDTGSALLVEHLPLPLAGPGADLGCGYGFLAHEVLRTSPEVDHVTLLDHDARAVACARANLAPWADRDLQFIVDDIAAFAPTVSYAWIVMNPPFHTGAQTTTSLGEQFVRIAWSALRPGGVLYMVANAFLSYDRTLATLGATVTEPARADGFRLLYAAKTTSAS